MLFKKSTRVFKKLWINELLFATNCPFYITRINIFKICENMEWNVIWRLLILEKLLQTNLYYIEGATKIFLELVRKSAWPTYSIQYFKYINSGFKKLLTAVILTLIISITIIHNRIIREVISWIHIWIIIKSK